MYTDVMGSKNWRFLFVAFYYFSVIIGLNIVVAFAIDMYGSIQRLDQEQQERLKKIREAQQERDGQANVDGNRDANNDTENDQREPLVQVTNNGATDDQDDDEEGRGENKFGIN